MGKLASLIVLPYTIVSNMKVNTIERKVRFWHYIVNSRKRTEEIQDERSNRASLQ
ncbi:hypothetical protein [Paenisporosarcina sp. TG20]|uniref:hypothetical protein n=1 Tax=Paenisporosarcina sp. TG20 TaxID=1211706 RepID=UPI0002E6B007|nr:hypothetical protein [Paenisporosarcina sp. TG20]